MGDQKYGRVADAALQSLADFGIRFGIDGGERVVKDQNRCLAHQRARHGGALLLSAGERDAALADHGVIALRQVTDGVVHTGDGGGAAQLLFLGVFAGDADVFPQRAGKQKRLLQDDGGVFPQPCLLYTGNIRAADGDVSAVP